MGGEGSLMNSKDGDKSAKPEEPDVEEVLEAQAKAEGQTYSDFLKLDKLLALQPGFDNNSDPLCFSPSTRPRSFGCV